MRLVGHDDLQARSAYQPIVHAYGARRILFVGHHAGEALNPLTARSRRTDCRSSTSRIRPRRSISRTCRRPAPTRAARNTCRCATAARCRASTAGRDPAKVYAIRTNGQLSYEVLDVTDPRRPTFVTTIAETGTSSRPKSDRGDRETHKFQWDCATGIAYLNGTAQGWRVTRVLQAFDVARSDARRSTSAISVSPATSPTRPGPYPEPQIAGLHQPTVVGGRMYLGYNSGDDGVLQIVDRDKFLLGESGARSCARRSEAARSDGSIPPTAANLRYPEIARVDMPSYWGVHTAKPIYGFEIADYADNSDARTRDLLLVSSESETFRCQEPRDVMTIFDITEERRPAAISTFQVPEEPGDFCHRGGRFGPHSFADAYNPTFDKKLVVLAYFNAGVRVVDIRNPFVPNEVARFIPEITANTTESCIEIDGTRECKRAIQTNNVNLDDRGYIYALDRASTGLHILELTGAARAIAGL